MVLYRFKNKETGETLLVDWTGEKVEMNEKDNIMDVVISNGKLELNPNYYNAVVTGIKNTANSMAKIASIKIETKVEATDFITVFGCKTKLVNLSIHIHDSEDERCTGVPLQLALDEVGIEQLKKDLS